MGEGSLYAPEHAALALLQVEGDSFEAAFHLRAYRATLERRYFSETLDTREMFVIRRISSTFRDIPGGQILGPTRDYSFRLLNPALLEASLGSIERFIAQLRDEIDPAKLHAMTSYKKVIDVFLKEGLMSAEPRPGEDRRVFDVTREAIKFPVPRSGALQMLARAETGALMCMAYSTMRGFGQSHQTVGELRIGDVPVRVADRRGRTRYIGKVRVSEAEMAGRTALFDRLWALFWTERDQGDLHGHGGECTAQSESGEPGKQPGVCALSHGSDRELWLYEPPEIAALRYLPGRA
jgi:alpha-D-ribose 1-methylphosphonate 5-triphosphate synthase subunit PhnI